MAEKDNLLIWDEKKRGHYEVYYLKFNQPSTQAAWWIRYTLCSPLPGKGEPIAELWGIFFDGRNPQGHAAFKHTFPFTQAKVGRDKFRFQIGEAVLSHSSARGRLDSAGKSLEWDLTFQARDETFFHFPYAGMYKASIPKTKVCSPHINSLFSGTVRANGKTFTLKNEPGQQTHIWGSKHAFRWVWGHCNLFQEDPSAILEVLSAQIKIGPLRTPVTSVFHLVHEGRRFTVNRLSESVRVKTKWDIGSWTLRAETEGRRFDVHMAAPLHNFVGVEYTDPDSEKAYCYNTKIADCTVDISERIGGSWKPAGRLTCKAGSAFEIAQRKKDLRVAVRI
ncbi:MAG: hypothetical protein HYY13_06165 [Nitrospirae bacterium]|nr:hypothetical protein [Nitrospirota bacterium]